MFVWKMKAPEKKPLVRRERPDETRAKVRRGSQKRHIAPIKALSEFHSDNGRVWNHCKAQLSSTKLYTIRINH